MGQVICPNGLSVQTDKFEGSRIYEHLVRDLKSERCTPEHRAKCLNVISEVGLFSYGKEIISYIHVLASETYFTVLEEACKEALAKIAKRSKKPTPRSFAKKLNIKESQSEWQDRFAGMCS
jgi:hypothetical protein